MNTKVPQEVIDRLKNALNIKVIKDFDDLEKVQMTCIAHELLEKYDQEKMAEYIKWSMKHWETGHLASKLNLIIQQQNLSLMFEVEKLKEENKKLLMTLDFNEG